jgi:hypothetical protein
MFERWIFEAGLTRNLFMMSGYGEHYPLEFSAVVITNQAQGRLLYNYTRRCLG